MKNKSHTPFILASASPQRKNLLSEIGIVPDQIIPADIDETPHKNETPRPYVKRMALEKAHAIASTQQGAFILAADTVVVMGRRILQKPADAEESYKFLSLMSGRRHKVLGGICLITPTGQSISKTCETVVKFKSLSHDEKQSYVDSGEWQGKAGGYGIQGAASTMIPFISGSYSNIVGLDVYTVMQLLRGNGYQG